MLTAKWHRDTNKGCTSKPGEATFAAASWKSKPEVRETVLTEDDQVSLAGQTLK